MLNRSNGYGTDHHYSYDRIRNRIIIETTFIEIKALVVSSDELFVSCRDPSLIDAIIIWCRTLLRWKNRWTWIRWINNRNSGCNSRSLPNRCYIDGCTSSRQTGTEWYHHDWVINLGLTRLRTKIMETKDNIGPIIDVLAQLLNAQRTS